MKRSIRLSIGIPLLVILGGFLLIQLVPYGRDHSNPPVVKEPNWDSPQTRELVRRACFACHSNETVWPWYSNIAPVSWLTQRDVTEGRSRLNFSDWQGSQTGGERGAGEIAGIVQEGEMPPWFYVMMHSEAKLSAAEKQPLIDGINATLNKP